MYCLCHTDDTLPFSWQLLGTILLSGGFTTAIRIVEFVTAVVSIGSCGGCRHIDRNVDRNDATGCWWLVDRRRILISIGILGGILGGNLGGNLGFLAWILAREIGADRWPTKETRNDIGL